MPQRVRPGRPGRVGDRAAAGARSGPGQPGLRAVHVGLHRHAEGLRADPPQPAARGGQPDREPRHHRGGPAEPAGLLRLRRRDPGPVPGAAHRRRRGAGRPARARRRARRAGAGAARGDRLPLDADGLPLPAGQLRRRPAVGADRAPGRRTGDLRRRPPRPVRAGRRVRQRLRRDRGDVRRAPPADQRRRRPRRHRPAADRHRAPGLRADRAGRRRAGSPKRVPGRGLPRPAEPGLRHHRGGAPHLPHRRPRRSAAGRHPRLPRPAGPPGQGARSSTSS